jgi:flavin-dependent dehydrogenase
VDIRIVGGGFAGIVTGLQILTRDACAEHNVTVYEARGSISTTLCGEGLSESTLSRLEVPGFDHRPYIGRRFKGAAWYLSNGKHIRIDDACFTMDRARWIPALAERFEALGGRIASNHRVSEAEARSMPGDLIVGAEGPGSRVRAIVGCDVRLRLGIQYRMAETSYETDRLIFVTDKRYSPEYSWIFPRGDLDNVGLLAEGDGADWDRLDRFMAAWKVGGRKLRKEAYPIAFNGTKQQSGRYVLVGDAGGQTNPVTKGGMASVVFASEILADCIREGRIGEYGERVMRHPIMDASFRRAVAIIEASSNERLERWTRFLPDSFSAKPRDAGPGWDVALRTMAANPLAVPSFLRLYRALSLSRRYSW